MAGRRVVVALGIVIAGATLIAPRRRPPASVVPMRVVDVPAPVARAAMRELARPLVLPPLRRAVRTSGPARIAGIVREHGVPVADASIWTVPMPQPGHVAGPTERGGEEALTTDAGGRFVLDDLPPGELAIWAVHEGRASALLQPLSLSPGERLDDVELELTGSSIADGIVVDERGDRVNADIGVFAGGVELAHAFAYIETPFHFDSLPDDGLTIDASASSNDDDEQQGAKLAVDHPAAALVLRVRARPRDVVVEVVDESGVPDDGAFVSIDAADVAENAMVNDAGVAKFSLRAGKVTIVASDDARELASDPVELDSDGESVRTVRVVLRPTTCASGRVLDASGAPAAGMVELSTPSSTTNQLVMLEEGTYRFCIGRTGTYELRYSPLFVRLAPDKVYGDVVLDVDLTQGRTALRDVRLPAPRKLRMRIVDEEGTPTNGSVAIESSDGRSQCSFLPTDESGVVTANVIGSVRLRAVTAMAGSAPVRAPDVGGEITLALARFANVEVLLRGAPPGTLVRCGTEPWATLASTALADLSCHPGDTLEAKVGTEQRRFSVPVDLDETTYTELRWE